MIAKITRGKNPGNIGAYLHGPGTANEHTYMHGGKKYLGGVVVGGNLHLDGDAMPDHWVKEFRAAMRTRPEIRNPIWHVSLRNTERDRTLSNAEWADAGQTFAERMGFDQHPWVMVRHGEDHVHLVVSRINDVGEVWHGRHDRRNAQRACTALEKEYGLAAAPRRRQRSAKQSVHAEREHFKKKEVDLADLREKAHRAREIQEWIQEVFPGGPGSSTPRIRPPQHTPVARPYRPTRDKDQDRGFER